MQPITANPQAGSRTRPIVFWLVAAAAALVPLESFIIALCADTSLFPDKLLFAGQFVIEAAIDLALVTLILSCVVTGRGLRRTPLDLPLLILLALVALSIAVNHAPLIGSLMNLRSALRYVAVFYLVTQAGLTRRQVAAILYVILIGGVIQVTVGAMQWLVGYDLKIHMLPYTSDIHIAGKARHFALVERGREIGSLFGTLGDTLYFGLFLVVVLAVAVTHIRKWRAWHALDLAALCLAIAYSYSRAAVLAAGLTLAAFAAARLGVRRVAAVACLLTALGLASIGASMVLETDTGAYQHPRLGRHSITANMTNIFSADYLERAKRQRLGAVLGVAPTALFNAPVLGFGPNQAHAIVGLNQAKQTRLYKTMSREGFEDVYWVAMLCYLGILGTLAVFWMGMRLAWSSASIARLGITRGDPVLRWAGLASLCIIAQAAWLMLFNRVPEVRTFSFYLWLLPALAFAARQDARSNDTSKQP